MPTLIANLCIFLFLVACTTKSESVDERFTLPPGYSLSEREKIFLPAELDEISGIAWHEDHLLAIEDESSVIFRLDPKSGKILEKQKFEKNNDIEDLIIRQNTAWVLRSNGNLYQVTDFLTEEQKTHIFEFPIKQSRDLEAIANPKGQPFIYLFCKVCEWDERPEKFSVFRFSLELLEFDADPFQVIHRSQLKALLPKVWKKVKMQPSAAAIHPLTGELYLISSTGKWLMTLDREWNPTSFHWLSQKDFKQPEGITFDDFGNLYISNEAAGGNANLMRFTFQK